MKFNFRYLYFLILITNFVILPVIDKNIIFIFNIFLQEAIEKNNFEKVKNFIKEKKLDQKFLDELLIGYSSLDLKTLEEQFKNKKLMKNKKEEMKNIIDTIFERNSAIYKQILKSIDENNLNDYQIKEILNGLEQKNLKMFQGLIQLGANINAKNDKNQTPLILATQGNSKELVKYILSTNANVFTKDKTGKTAKEYAANNFEIKKLIEEFINKKLEKSINNLSNLNFNLAALNKH